MFVTFVFNYLETLHPWHLRRHSRHLRSCALEQRGEFCYVASKFPLRHAVLPYVRLLGELTLLNELLQLVPVTRTILLTVYADEVLHLRNGSLTRHLRRTPIPGICGTPPI